MSYKFLKEEIENLTQDHLAKDIYYTNKGECFKIQNEKTEKIFETIQLKPNLKITDINPVPEPNVESLIELNNLNPQEINHGIKFSSVCSGKNILIHGGGTIATLGNANNEDYVFVGGIVPRGIIFIEFICPVSCQGLSFGMATLNEIKDLPNIKKNFKSFRTSSRRRVGMEINYEQKIVKFFLEGILKDKTFSIKEKNLSYPCIILNNKNVSVILNPFARLSNVTFPLYLAPDSVYKMPNKSIFSKFLFLTNLPKVKFESKLNFLKTHFNIETLKEENIFIPINSDGEAKGIIIIKFDKKTEQNNFRTNNKSIRINNNEIKILEENYLNDLSEKNIFKIMDLISMTKKDNIKLDISHKKLNILENLKFDFSEEERLIVEFIIENFNNINFLYHTIDQMLKEIEYTAKSFKNNEKFITESENRKNAEEEMLKENSNLKLEYLPLSDKMFIIDNDAIKIFVRNSQGFYDYEFYSKESKKLFNIDSFKSFNIKNNCINDFMNILVEKNEMNFFLNNIPWNNIMNEIIDIEILKCVSNFVNGLKNIKELNTYYICFPLKRKFCRKFVEIIINYLNRIVFIMREKNKINHIPNPPDENLSNVEMDQFLPFAPDYEEPLNEENKKLCFYDEYKNLSTETILLLYKIVIKISEQIEVNYPLYLEKHSSISQCIRWGSAFSRLSTFINFPNFMDKVSVMDLANKGFYVDHTLYNELKFHGHNFIRSLNFNKIRDHDSLDNIINQEYPFNYNSLCSYWPNIELAYTINASPAKLHQDPITKERNKIELFNKSNISELLITSSSNGLTNIWDYSLGMNLLGSINIKKGIKEINSFSKLSEVFWMKSENYQNLKALSDVINEENFDITLSNGSVKNTPELGKDKEKIVPNNELVNNLYIMGFPIEACKYALKQNKNNLDKALEFLLEKSSDQEFMKQFDTVKKNIDEEIKISCWNCDLCTFLNTKGNLNCEMCSTLIPERILNEHVDTVARKKEEEKLKANFESNSNEEIVVQFRDCLIKNVHVVYDKSDPMSPVLICAILFDFILNKTIISIYKFMINPIILRDFISYEKDSYISTIDNRKFVKLEDLLVYLIENYSLNILSLYPLYNKGVNSLIYEGKSRNFNTLIPIEHYYKELSVNSYYDSFIYENQAGNSELLILSESVNSEITVNYFKIKNLSKVNNMNIRSIDLEPKRFNLNNCFLNEFPTELKILKDLKFTYIIDQNKIRKFNIEMELTELKEFNSIGLFKKIEPIYDKNLILKSVKIYDDVNKFTEVFLDNNKKNTRTSNDKNINSNINSSNEIISNFNSENLEINEIEFLSELLNFEKVNLKLNCRNKYSIIKGGNSISSKKIFVDLKERSDLAKNTFDLEFMNKVPLVISNIIVYFSTKNKTLKTLNYSSDDLLNHTPKNVFNLKEMNTELENKNDLHDLIPLTVTDFKGAQFQQFINVSSILFGKNFTSNYFKPEFLFSHIHEKMMSINSVVLGSELNSKTGEIPFGEGLLFLINDLDSINLAHEFTHFDLSSFSNFVINKEIRKEEFFEWEPVAYVNMAEKEYIRTKLYEKRPCKYILLLPTNARSLPKNYKKGFNNSVMSLNLFAVEGTVYSNEFERKEYFNSSTKSLLANNSISENTGIKVKISADCEASNNLLLKEFDDLKINGIIPNTFCSFENTDMFISKNRVENLTFPNELISKLQLQIEKPNQSEFEILGITVECLTFKNIDDHQLESLNTLKNVDVHSLRMNLIDKDKFDNFNRKFCDLLINEKIDFKKKHALIKYFNCLILKIPSIVEKICNNLDLTQFIIVNILNHDEESLINSSLSFLISIKLSIKSENIINSILDILDDFKNLKISFLGLNSFMLLVNNTFNETSLNSNDSIHMKSLYSKFLKIINSSLLNLNEKSPLTKVEIFIKNFLKTELFPFDEKLFSLNKEELSKNTDISQFKLIPNSCLVENHHGSIKFTIDLFKVYNVKTIKLNFTPDEQNDHYFKIIVWGSDVKPNVSVNKEDFKILYYRNYLDDMWKQLTKYESDIKVNEKYFLTKDFRSLEVPEIDHKCRYLIIEINTDQAQRIVKKLPQITIIPEVIGELIHDREPYIFHSITELFEGFISNKIETQETLNKKYNVKYSVDNSKFMFGTQEENCDSNLLAKKESNLIEKSNEKNQTNFQIKNSLKTFQSQVETIVLEYLKNTDSYDLIAENKIKSLILNISNLQKNIASSDKLTKYDNLKESQYIILNYFIKQIKTLIDKSNLTFQEVFNTMFEYNSKETFILYFIESLILNSIGEQKEEAINFLDNYIWNNLNKENLESIFNKIFEKFMAKESTYRSSRVLLEGLSKINFDINIILNKLKVAFERKYQEEELSDAFYSISSLILLLIMKVKNEKNKKNLQYELLIDSSLRIINDLTKETKFVKEVDDLILSHSLNLLQESYSHNNFESLNNDNDSQLVDFMIETLFSLWNNDYIKNKLFFIINKMIDPLLVLETIKNKNEIKFHADLDNIFKYTQKIYSNVQSFTIKFLDKLLQSTSDETSNYQLEYSLDLNNKILNIHSFLYFLKQGKSSDGEVDRNFSENFEKIKDKNLDIIKGFLKYFAKIDSKKIGISIENNLWRHIFSIISSSDLKRMITHNLLDELMFETFLKCDDDLKDNLYPQIIKVFTTLYSNEKTFPEEINDRLTLIILKLIDNFTVSEKIILPFLNQFLEIISCGESPFIEKKNEKLLISEEMKETLFVQTSNYIIKYLNYSSFTGSSSSNKIILQHLSIGISLLHIVAEYAEDYLFNLEKTNSSIDFSIRNYLIFITFNQYAEFTGANPTVLKISNLSKLANKIIDLCCKRKKLIEVVLSEFMTIVRKIDDKLLTKIKNSEISIKKGIVISKKLYYSLDLILNKCLYDDEITKYFAFDLQGFKFFVERVNKHKHSGLFNSKSGKSNAKLNYKLNKELLEYLTEESKSNTSQVKSEEDELFNENLNDLNYEEFALNGKLTLLDDPVNINTTNINWSSKKKGVNSYILTRDLKDKTYYEEVFSFKLNSLIELKNVFIAFTYSTNPERVSGITPSVFFMAGDSPDKMDCCLKLEKIDDHAYIEKSIFTYGFNFFASDPKNITLDNNYIENFFDQLINCKAKYFKFIVRRPIITANENSYQNKTNNMISLCLNHVSINGTKIADMNRVIEFIQEEEKIVSIKIISKIFTAEFIDTMKYFAKDTTLVENIKEIYDAYEPYIEKHANILSNILINVSKYVYELGEWLLNRLLNVDNTEIHAKLAVEITQNNPEYVTERVNKYLTFILNELSPDSSIYYSNNSQTRLKNLGKFADYLTVVLNGLIISPFFEKSMILDIDLNKFILIIKNLSKLSIIENEINKLITIILIPNKKLTMTNYLDIEEAIHLLHNFYLETNNYDYALILSHLVANNQHYEKIAVKRKIVSFYFDQFLDHINKGLRGKNMLSLMKIIKNFSFSNSVIDIIQENDYDFKVLEAIKNKDSKSESILINNNCTFLENAVTFLRNSIIKREYCHVRLAKILIEDLEMCKQKIDKIYANHILMPLLRMENTVNLCLHPIDSFFNSILSAYCNIGHLTTNIKDDKLETNENKFIKESSLSSKSIETLQKILNSHNFNENYKFSHKSFHLKFTSDTISNNYIKTFTEGISELNNILILFYPSKPDKDANSATAFFLDSKFPKINSDVDSGDYPEYFIPDSDKNVLIQFDGEKFNKHILKNNSSSESIGEIVIEDGYLSFNLFSENDNPIRINISSEEDYKKDFTIKLNNKFIDKSFNLEFKPLYNGYFEVFTCDTLLNKEANNKIVRRESINFSSGKISPSKFIDINGNLDYEKLKTMKYYKKSNPLLITRNNPVYEIPANITIKHIKNLFGSGELNMKFLINQQILGDENAIQDTYTKYNKLSNEHNILDICYDINQLRGIFSVVNDAQTSIHNYEPQLPVYKAFEKLDGIMKILSVLKSSILMWKNKEAINVWLKWVDDVEKFSVLPTFFSTLINHQKCFNIIFDLLCGLYDQENFNKEICIETSNYIYEIINNTFVATESSNLRYIAIEKEIFKNILEKLEVLTREKPRRYSSDSQIEAKEDDNQLKANQPNKPADDKKSKKGVGYGSDHTGDNKSWDVNTYLENKKANSEQIAAIIKLLANFFNTKELKINEMLNKLILESVILPVLESAYRGGTLLELAKQDTLYYAYLDLTLKLSENKNLIPYLLDISKDYKPSQTESIYNLLGQLNEGAKIFSNCIKGGTNEEATHEEKLALAINNTYDNVSKNIKAYQVNLTSDKDYSKILKLPVEKSYCLLMRELSFDYMDMKDSIGKLVHYYATSLTKDNSPSKLIRLAQEYADLSRALPCEYTNSIFVRVDKDNMDFLKVLIMGSAGTPYAHGAFEFDVHFESNYPAGPPKVTLMTTGSGTVRFNPNLYSNGKVCLSLLGTWRGNSTENWDPKISTFLQVLISIQSIIMSDLVYFNEPSCEAEMGKPEGEARNEAYSNIVKYCNIKYAMIEQLKKPSKGFEEVIQRHFYLKKNQIIEEVQQWIQKSRTTIAKYSSFSYDHNPSWAQKMNSQPAFTKMMEDIFVELEKELNDLPIPSDLKKKQEESEKNALNKKKLENKLDYISLDNVDVTYENEISETDKELNINDEAVKDRWSRYIGAMGLDAVQRQANSNIFLSGASGLGIEIAKNLVLSGCKKFVLHDTKITSYLDLSSQFFLSEEDVDHNRAERSLKKLQQLNFYVKVICNTNPIPKTEELLDSFGLQEFNVVILTECDIETLITVNKYCRKRNIIFINADLYGVFGRVINDFGENFKVNDIDGEELKDCMIKSISNEKEGLVTVLDNTRHNFQDGDEIIITEVIGMKNLKNEKDYIFIDETEKKAQLLSINETKHVVKVKNPQSFFIGDTTNYTAYDRNGMAKQIKSIKHIQFKDIEKVLFDKEISFIDQNMAISDFTKIGHTNVLHIGFQAINDFIENFKHLPSPWNIEDFKKLLEISEKISLDYKYELTNKDKKLLAFLSFTSQAQFNPLSAFFGGLIAQEAVKAMTGKFMPINQIFYYDSIEVLPGFEIKDDEKVIENLEKLVNNENHSLTKSRIDGIQTIVGKEILNKMQKMKILVVGAGAIGCELLKNFSMLEVGSFKNNNVDENEKNGIIVTDPDVIEVSNLNRQFLFREKHLRLPKSSTAAAAVIQMNKNLKSNVYAKLDKVWEETEHIFTDKFFSSLSLVANALDNIRARRYVDSRCVSNRIPLLESGTLGPKGHVQVIVPFKTESYSSQQDPEVSTDIPQCTLKMFPEEALHCIEWARDLFGKLFTQKPKNLNRILEEGIESQDFKIIKQALNLLRNKPQTFNDCIKIAREKFEKLFRNNIKQLMYSYPLDKKNKDGSLFWSLPKRPPTEVIFDSKDALHYNFIASYACLIARQFKINISYENPRKEESKKEIAEIASKIQLPEFKINTLKAKEIEKEVEKEKKELSESDDKEKINVEEKTENNEKNLENLITEFKLLSEKHKINNYIELSEKERKQIELNSEEFEKDNDANFHIDVIYSMSNLRCRNYKLEEMDWMKVKIKAGKIIPALATTTASIAGLQALELVKLAKNMEIEHIRNSFLNLAIPYLQASEPGPVGKNKLIEGLEVTLWERWEFKPEKNNLQSVYEYLLGKYKLFPRDCFLGKKAVFPYNAYAGDDKKQIREEIMNKDLFKLLGINCDDEYVDLMITFTANESSEEYLKNTPIIRLLFK